MTHSKQKALKITFVFLNLIFLASCDEKKEASVIRGQIVNDTEIGRYQIVNDTKNDGVFWVDTVTGRVEQCQWGSFSKKWNCYAVRSGY